MKNLKTKSIGVSLIEIMLVISILTIITLMSTRYFYVTRNAQRATEAAETVKYIVAASERWLATNTDYTNLTLQALVDRDYLPASFDNKNNPSNPWGGGIIVSGAGNTLTISLTNLDSKGCIAVASNLLHEACDQTTAPVAFCTPVGVFSNYTATITIPQTCYSPQLAPT